MRLRSVLSSTQSTEQFTDEFSAVLHNAVERNQARLSQDTLQRYVDGAARLRAEAMGWAPLVAYLEQTPTVLVMLDEDLLEPILRAASALRGRAGERVVDQFFALLVLAAECFAERNLFARYIGLVQELAAIAPQSLEPLFDHLPTLLEHLSIGGLAKWARMGVQIHARDREAQRRYFSLDSADSLAILKLEGEGMLFSQVERRLRLYLRALWGREVQMRPKARRDKNVAAHRPFLDDGVVYLPDAYSALIHGSSSELYMAAAAHAAAHLMFTRERFKVGSYKPIKLVVISLLEDARVEQLAIDAFPGLRHLWGKFHTATPESGATFEQLAARLSRALLDESYADDNPWVRRGAAMFRAAQGRLHDQQLAIELASPLANDIGQMRLQFNFKTYAVQPSYRDDHSFLWDYSNADTPPPQLEEDDEIIVEEVKTNPKEAPPTPQLDLKEAQVEEPDPKEKDSESPHAIALDMVLRSVNYGEWDYLIGMERPAWCTLFEKQPVAGDPDEIDTILRQDEALLGRVKKLIRSAQIQRAVRLRKQYDGDRLDLDQAIRAAIDLRVGHQPDPRISMRSARRGRDLSVLVLLDLSKSTGDFVGSALSTVLNLAKESVALLAEAMHELGDKFAIHGFTSNGRRDVTYYRFKDFDQEYNRETKGFLAGATPQLSTRMGTAIRHAGQLLRFRSSDRKLLLMLTDGEPSDVDVYDRDYLTHDAKRAVDGLARFGVHSFCLSLDTKADRYVSRIFGAKNYLVVDRLRSLPEKLPYIYLRVTQH
jgi:hypothetical protein